MQVRFSAILETQYDPALTRVAVVGEGEGLVAMLAVSQRPDHCQPWLVLGLGRVHVDGGLTRPSAVREEL